MSAVTASGISSTWPDESAESKAVHLDHINIRAPAELLHRVRDFYCNVLGFTEGFRPEFSRPGYWLYIHDRPLVHLSENGENTGTGGTGHLDHVAFRSSGVQRLVTSLEALGIEYRSNFIPELRMTQLFFFDPAGTGIEVNFPEEEL